MASLTPETNGSHLPAPTTYSQYRHQQQTKQHRGEKPSPFTGGIQPAGESGRKGFHPWKFLRISFRSASRASTACNIFWPVVPAALAVRCKSPFSSVKLRADKPDALPNQHVLIFTLAYISMVPCANLVGFAGQELSRKMPHVLGVLTEITFGSVVEIVLFMVLLSMDQFYVIKAAILGSILATMLLCLGFVFFVGGLTRHEQTFDDAISEVGSGLLFTS